MVAAPASGATRTSSTTALCYVLLISAISSNAISGVASCTLPSGRHLVLAMQALLLVFIISSLEYCIPAYAQHHGWWELHGCL